MKSWGGDCSAYFQDKKKFGLNGGGYKWCCGSDSFVLLLMILYHLWIVVFLHFFCGLLLWFVWLIELWFSLLKKLTSVQLFSMCSVWLAVEVVDGPSLWLVVVVVLISSIVAQRNELDDRGVQGSIAAKHSNVWSVSTIVAQRHNGNARLPVARRQWDVVPCACGMRLLSGTRMFLVPHRALSSN